MAHPQQRRFCDSIRARFPHYFQSVLALDIGSLDINGNNLYLFDETSIYLGVDVAPGRNVDIVCPAHQLGLPDATFDMVVSTECLEHDQYWSETLRNAVRMLRPGGLLLVTCATTGRPEHGTKRTTPENAPLLTKFDSAWADYYRNLTEADFRSAINFQADFALAEFSIGEETHDLYFFGIKQGVFETRADRSMSLSSHPSRVLLKDYQDQLARAFDALRKSENDIRRTHAFLDAESQKTADLSAQRDALAKRTSPSAWAILCTPHALFLGHLLASRLSHHGWSAEVLTEAPEGFPHDMYIVIAAQVFEHLPPGEKRIIYQVEQSVSTRWFSDAYIHAMKHSRAVLDYALVNIGYLASKGIVCPHVFYLPVGADAQYMRPLEPVEKTTDVLFYGDLNPRRRELLATLEKHFVVRVYNDVYGVEMVKAIRAARIVVNLHYYENALLETARIQECLSLGTPVVSEAAQDQDNYPELQGAVAFFEAGNHQAMVQAIKRALELGTNSDVTSLAAHRGNARFVAMFDRFLAAQGFLVLPQV